MKQVAIIGAGIIGATTAYQLAKQNIAVTIIDAQINGRATSAAAGIICPWVSKRRNKAWYELAKNGAAYYPTLLNELKQDGYENTGYKQVGAIRLHEDIDQLKQLKEIAEKRRVSAPEIGELHLLTNEEVKGNSHLLKKIMPAFLSAVQLELMEGYCVTPYFKQQSIMERKFLITKRP